MPNRLPVLLFSETDLTTVSRDELRSMFNSYDTVHYDDTPSYKLHRAFVVCCDLRDTHAATGVLLTRLSQAIDLTYTSEELDVCNEGWGGIDGVSEAKHLIKQVYSFDADPLEYPDVYVALVEANMMTVKEVEDLTQAFASGHNPANQAFTS